MTEQKQIKKGSKAREEYSKFKPFADDLRKAESWCELDGVLNRYQTVKNLSQMGYRKQSVGEWHWIADDSPMCNICGNVFDTNDDADAGLWNFCPNCGARMKGANNEN